MGIQKDVKTGKWSARFARRNPATGKPISFKKVGLSSKAEALRALQELEAHYRSKLLEKPKVIWKVVCLQFMEFYEDEVMKSTAYNAWKTLQAHTFERWGSREITLITTQDIRQLVKVELGSLSEPYLKTVLKHIRLVFNFALEKGFINRSPVPQLKFRNPDKLKGVLTEEQARRFLTMAKSTESQWYPHWALALFTGMRSGELYALRWGNVNLDDRLIFVREAWNNRDGFKSTKSGHDRILEIAPPLIPLLKELKLQNLEGDRGFVLPRIRAWDKGEQARELRMFLLGMGLPQIRFHDLRASWATLLLSKNIAPIVVMKMGGWKDMKTMAIYVRQAGVDIRGASDVLNYHDHTSKIGVLLPLDVHGKSR